MFIDINENEAENIFKNYLNCMKNKEYYFSGLKDSILSRSLSVWTCYNQLDKLGAFCGFRHEDYFIISHFAPTSHKAGVELAIELLWSEQKTVLAVTATLANMLKKIGFRYLGKSYQMFNDQKIEKFVFCNRSKLWNIKELYLIYKTTKENHLFDLKLSK